MPLPATRKRRSSSSANACCRCFETPYWVNALYRRRSASRSSACGATMRVDSDPSQTTRASGARYGKSRAVSAHGPQAFVLDGRLEAIRGDLAFPRLRRCCRRCSRARRSAQTRPTHPLPARPSRATRDRARPETVPPRAPAPGSTPSRAHPAAQTGSRAPPAIPLRRAAPPRSSRGPGPRR